MRPVSRNNGNSRDPGAQRTHGIGDMSRRREERGAAAVEMLLMAPLLMAFVLVVVAGGRYTDSRGQVNDAAYAAARAASLESTIEAGQQAGREAAVDALDERGKACVNLEVSFAGTDFQPGGQVQVSVQCRADLRDVVGFGIPGSKWFSADAVVPIERYRAKADGFTNSDALAAANSRANSRADS
jgi:hypothetical protein